MTQPSDSLRAISKEEFERWAPSLKVIVHEHARRYSSMELGGSRQAVAMSWRSDAIEPVVAVSEQAETWIGVDQRVACVSGDGRVVVSLGMASSVLDVRCFGDCTVVLCETEVVVFNRDFSIRAISELGDIPNEVQQRDGRLFVVFDDGRQEGLG